MTQNIHIPDEVAELANKPKQAVELGADFEEFKRYLLSKN
jgi:hypothetical protein